MNIRIWCLLFSSVYIDKYIDYFFFVIWGEIESLPPSQTRQI